MNEQTKAQVEAYAEECRTEQLELLRTLGKMPAPTRREDFRAAFCRDWLRAQGAENVRIDSAKNVICKLGPDTEELVVFAAHTDIVFPDVENLPLREEGGKLFAPGIGDDTANLVNLLMAAKYLIQKQTAAGIWCAGGGECLRRRSGQSGRYEGVVCQVRHPYSGVLFF